MGSDWYGVVTVSGSSYPVRIMLKTPAQQHLTVNQEVNPPPLAVAHLTAKKTMAQLTITNTMGMGHRHSTVESIEPHCSYSAGALRRPGDRISVASTVHT